MYGSRISGPSAFPSGGTIHRSGQRLADGGPVYDESYDATSYNGFTARQSMLVRAGTSTPSFFSAKSGKIERIKRLVGYRTVLVRADPPRRVKVQRIDPITGRRYYKRIYLLIEKKIPVYVKSQRRRVIDLPPNALTTIITRLTTFGNRVSATRPRESNKGPFTQTYVGDLGLGLRPLGLGSAIGHTPHRYVNWYLPSDYYTTAMLNTFDARALGRLREKVRTADFNLGQFLGEIEQTLSLLANAAKAIAKIYAQLRRGELFQPAGLIRDGFVPSRLANATLAWNYGVKPLLQDIDQAMKTLAEGTRSQTFDIVSTVKDRVDFRSIGEDGAANDMPRYRSELTRVANITVKYKARVRVDNPRLAGLAQLGLNNPAALVWEITPWSHVIDWIFSIGRYLSDVHLFDGLSVVSLHKTTVVEQRGVININFPGKNGAGYDWSGNPNIGSEWTTVYVNREIKTPSLLTKPPLPKFKNPFSTTHIINTWAHVTQLLR